MTTKNKTKPSSLTVTQYIKGLKNPQQQQDAKELVKIIKRATKEKPVMWGKSIVGFGKYHYKYDSGREGDFMRSAFSVRKSNITVYVMPGVKKYESQLKKIGKHKTGVSCLYIRNLETIDKKILEDIVTKAYKEMGKLYPYATKEEFDKHQKKK